MTTLVPRWFGDLTDWLDLERPTSHHVIKVEDMVRDNEYKIRAELPGLNPEHDIQVSIDQNVLSIHAERRTEEKDKNRSEFHYGMLQRSIRLPGNSDPEHIKASYDKGILEVTVPLKASATAGRQIPVNAA